MLSLRQLIQRTGTIRKKFAPTAGFRDQRIVPGTRYDNSVMVQATFDTLTDKTATFDNTYRDGAYYDTVIKFTGMHFVTEKDIDHPFEIKFINRSFFISKPSLNRSQCAVSCTCKDFYFMWMYWDRQQNSFANIDFIKYQHVPLKPGQVRRGPVNPGQVPGVCKHIARLANYFTNEGFLDA